MRNKIRTRLLLYFSGSLIIFSLVIGVTFSVLFSRHNMDVHKAELENRAIRIAQSLAGFWTGETEQGQGMMGQGMGYGAYLRFLDDIAMTDVWIVDRNLEQITRGHGQETLEYKDLPPGAEDVITAAMDGSLTAASFAQIWRARRNFGPYLRSVLDRAAATGHLQREAKVLRSLVRRFDQDTFRKRLAEVEARLAQPV